MIFVSSWPARPTKGMPWTSSSAPGASPTNIRSASGFPTPNTIWRRPCVCSLQRVQSPISVRTAIRASAELAKKRAEVPGLEPSPSALRSSADKSRSTGPGGGDSPDRRRHAASRLVPATPSSAANRRCSLTASRSTEELFDAIEDTRRDLRLRELRNGLVAIGADERDSVGVDVKARVGARDIVGDDEIDVLLLALRPRVLYDLIGFGGKSDQDRTVAFRRAPLSEFGEDVRRAPERQRQHFRGIRVLGN